MSSVRKHGNTGQNNQIRYNITIATIPRDRKQVSNLKYIIALADGCADMVTALAALRGIVEAADDHYSSAVGTNLALWQQVS